MEDEQKRILLVIYLSIVDISILCFSQYNVTKFCAFWSFRFWLKLSEITLTPSLHLPTNQVDITLYISSITPTIKSVIILFVYLFVFCLLTPVG